MRHLLILFFTLLLFTACDKAKFDTGGSVTGSGSDANGFEVVTEEEEADILGEENTGDEGIGDNGTECEGDCPDGGDDDCEVDCDDGDAGNSGDDDDDDGDCEGDCDDGGDRSCRDKKHDHKKKKKKKKKKKQSMVGNECESCVICPKNAFEKDTVRASHSCESNLQSHKIHICKWPAGDQSKEMTLCVAKASLQGLVRMRRQDRYFVGACPSEE